MRLYRELQTRLNYKEPVFIKEMKERGKKGRKELEYNNYSGIEKP